MRKLLILALALSMVISLSSCGDGGGTGSGDGDSAGDASAPDIKAELSVGFIFLDSATDNGFTQAHDNGRLALQDYFGGSVATMAAENVDENDNEAVRGAAVRMIEGGCKVIIGCSFGYMAVLQELAAEHDDVTFLHFSGFMMSDNMDYYFGAMEEPRYLSGMVAGMMTRSNRIGYVAAYPYSEVLVGINAFALGAQSVNPAAEVEVAYIDSWYDPEREKSAAESLIGRGCDVIGQHTNTAEPIRAAEENGVFAIGYNLDNSEAAPNAYLTAPVWDHGSYYIRVIERILDGEFTPEGFYGRMRDGYVDLAPLTYLVPDDVAARVNEARDMIMTGELAPFSGEILDANGRTLCAAGQSLSKDEIWEISEVVRGVRVPEI